MTLFCSYSNKIQDQTTKHMKLNVLYSACVLTSGYLMPPSVTLILLISSGLRIPNWTLFTIFTGALESLVMIDVMMDVLSETF